MENTATTNHDKNRYKKCRNHKENEEEMLNQKPVAGNAIGQYH